MFKKEIPWRAGSLHSPDKEVPALKQRAVWFDYVEQLLKESE